MARDVLVTLDGQNCRVPALNIGQLEEVAALLSAPNQSTAFEIIKIALRRADPKPDLEVLAPTLSEIGQAVREILVLSGLQNEENPQAASAGTPLPTPRLVQPNS